MRTAAFSSIGLDDAAYTFRNPFVAWGLSLPNVVEAFANLRHGGIWMPITYISYMADASFCRVTGFPLIAWMHFINVLLHCGNALLLGKLLCGLFETRYGEERGPSVRPAVLLFAVLLWALHPLRAEPVAWIACRKELLWSLFTLAGLICWIKALVLFSSSANHQAPTTNHHLPATILFCLLACLSKPTAMCFPLLALLVAWRKKEKCNAMIIPLFLIAALTGVVAAYSQTHVAGQEVGTLYAAPLVHRLVNALSAIGFYVRTTFWPVGLHIDCRAVPVLWPLDAGWNFLALGLAVVAMVALKRSNLIHPPASSSDPKSKRLNAFNSNAFFIVSWFLLALLPTLGLFGSFGVEAHADRFTYLPSMAFSFLIVWIFAGRHALADKPDLVIGDRQPGSRPLKSFNLLTFNCLTAIIILLSVLTFSQLGFWRDDATAHRRTLACDQEHPRALVHVADARCSRHHDFDGGIRLYRQALDRADAVPPGGFKVDDAKAKLAYALATRGRQEDFEEVKRLGAAILREPQLDRRGLMLDALGTAFLHEGARMQAASLFKASIDAPDRFWPKASTQQKLDSCRVR